MKLSFCQFSGKITGGIVLAEGSTPNRHIKSTSGLICEQKMTPNVSHILSSFFISFGNKHSFQCGIPGVHLRHDIWTAFRNALSKDRSTTLYVAHSGTVSGRRVKVPVSPVPADEPVQCNLRYMQSRGIILSCFFYLFLTFYCFSVQFP